MTFLHTITPHNRELTVISVICTDEAVPACSLWHSESTASTSKAAGVFQESLLTHRQ